MNRDQIPAYDPDGHFMALMDPPVAEKHLTRHLAVRVPGGIQLRESAATGLRDLSPQAKRRRFLSKGRS